MVGGARSVKYATRRIVQCMRSAELTTGPHFSLIPGRFGAGATKNMDGSVMKKFALPVLAASLFGFAVAAPARADVEAGMLTCHSAHASNFVVVSAQTFDCVFAPAAGGPPPL